MITVLQLARLPNIKVPEQIPYVYNQLIIFLLLCYLSIETALIISYASDIILIIGCNCTPLLCLCL